MAPRRTISPCDLPISNACVPPIWWWTLVVEAGGVARMLVAVTFFTVMEPTEVPLSLIA